jgi:hypothetical protein
VKKFISTHYYFEGRGSVTTLTKEERNAYVKSMNNFVMQRNQLLQESRTAAANNNEGNQPSKATDMMVAATVGDLKRDDELCPVIALP